MAFGNPIISASKANDLEGRNLTAYGGLLPVATILEKLSFLELVAEAVKAHRQTKAMSMPRFILAMVLASYIGFSCLCHLRFRQREPLFTEILGIPRLPPQSTFWRFLLIPLGTLCRWRRDWRAPGAASSRPLSTGRQPIRGDRTSAGWSTLSLTELFGVLLATLFGTPAPDRTRSGQKPRDCCRVHLEQPRSVSGCSAAFRQRLANLRLLLRRQLGTASADPPVFASSFQARLGSLPKHGSFELGECSDNLHHHSPCWRGYVDRLGETAESGSASPIRSITVSTSRSECDSRSSFRTTSKSPLQR